MEQFKVIDIVTRENQVGFHRKQAAKLTILTENSTYLQQSSDDLLS